MRRLSPVAAAVAVIAVVAGATLIGRSAGGRPVSGPESCGMPCFYVTLVATEHRGKPLTFPPGAGRHASGKHMPVLYGTVATEVAVVHASATGGVLATVRVPGWQGPANLGGISAAADDRTFAITAGSGIFLLHLAADGRSAQLRRLSYLSPGSVSAAVSPDGSKVAIPVEQQVCSNRACKFGIEVLSLATGTQKTWWSRHALESNLSWSPSGNEVMFYAGGANIQQYRLLSIAGPGGDILAASRPMPVPGAPLGGMALLTPNGRAVITSTGRVAGHGTVIAKIVEISASTGRRLRVLHVATAHYSGSDPWSVEAGCGVLALGPTGLQPLVQCFGFGWLHGSHFIPLPGGPVTPRPTSLGSGPATPRPWGFGEYWTAAW